MNMTNIERTESSLSADDLKNIDAVVGYWKQSFQQLKTLEMEVICTASKDNGVNVNNQLIYKGRFVYDAPKYYVQIQFADKKGVLGDVNTMGFDGDYYWRLSAQGNQKTLIKYPKDTEEPNIIFDITPFVLQFAFAFDFSAKKFLATLQEAQTWESLKRRITRIDRSATSKEMIFSIEKGENAISSDSAHESYKVSVASGDTPTPVSWEMTTTQQKGMRVEFNTSQSKIYSPDSWPFPFPCRITTLAYLHNTLMHQYEMLVPENSLKINQPVDAAMFTPKPDKDTKIIDGD